MTLDQARATLNAAREHGDVSMIDVKRALLMTGDLPIRVLDCARVVVVADRSFRAPALISESEA